MGNLTIFFKSLEEVLSYRLPSQYLLEFQGNVFFFFNHNAQHKIQENKYQGIFEEPVSTVHEQYFVFFLQKTAIINSVSTLRTAYHESCQVGPGWLEASRMQEIAPT
jgi:hypothetical protein